MSKSLLAQLMEKAETITDLEPKQTEITIDRKVIVQLVKTPRDKLFSANRSGVRGLSYEYDANLKKIEGA